MTAPAAEISVVGGIIAFPEETNQAFQLLTPEMFTNDWLSNTFAVCRELSQGGVAPDITMVESKIGKGNRRFLVRCVAEMPSLAGFNDYCAVVLEAWRMREINAELQEIALERSPSRQTVEQLERLIAKQRSIDQGLNDTTAVDFWGAVIRYMESLMAPKKAIMTGWSEFDFRVGGLQRKGFYAVAGRSGTGKTDFALALATNISARNRVSYFSMEMPVEQLMERVTSRMALVEANALRDHTVTPEDMTRISNALCLMKNKTNLIIDEKLRMSVAELESKILRQAPDVVFVDHIGLMAHNPAKTKPGEGVADTSQRLKEIAMKHDVVVVALVQETRDGEKGKSSLANLKGSDNLSNDTDGVFQMRAERPRDFVSGNSWLDAEVCVTKNRHGGIGSLYYHWQPQYHNWTPVDRLRGGA